MMALLCIFFFLLHFMANLSGNEDATYSKHDQHLI